LTSNGSEFHQDSELTSTLSLASIRSVPDLGLAKNLAESLNEEERKVLEELGRDDAMLIVITGPGRGSRFLIDEELLSIGRDPKNSIFLDDITVSRSHASIRRIEKDGKASFEVEDLKSLNGTYLNAKSVVKTSLNQGDELQIGKFRLTFFRTLKKDSKGE
jgi:pSer/pThr/pTyr-binding forkhead associated (FHA) protein